ncbi:MAG: ferrous iron transport protein B [Kiritimatiellae bacterium]|nr:ferrous iron transport protein B [Kiritimatiellia bacterium]
MNSALPDSCRACPLARAVPSDTFDHVIALAGNPNTGKTTVFNMLTGLRQHTGNWTGKTVGRAEGSFRYGERTYRIVDLPGTYSLVSASPDEEVARNFLLFERPSVTVIVVDASRLERNLNLVLQVLQLTDRAVVCVNLVDEARAHGIEVDGRALARELGVPVVLTAARRGEGIAELMRAVDEVANARVSCRPRRLPQDLPGLAEALSRISRHLRELYPRLNYVEWIALRLLEGDASLLEALREGRLAEVSDRGTAAPPPPASAVEALVHEVESLRWALPPGFHDRWVERVYAEAASIAARCVTVDAAGGRRRWESKLDRWLTSRHTGYPTMIALLGLVLWITIEGANVPSRLLFSLLVDRAYSMLGRLADAAGLPPWLKGLLVDGAWRTTAWVVSVMLPPMAIFFPLFTILEDFGYLPRVAFNLDALFRRAGAHGRQALTMSMGWGCNAAGVIATRIIDSPRERLIAILTNNFSLCNGRWPTQFVMATIFLGALAPPAFAGLAAATAVLGVALLGVALMFLTSWALSRSVLRGEPSAFSLELPPYRPPDILRTLYTSLIDRTLIVLWRAVVFALPAGIVLWVFCNVRVAGAPLAAHLVRWLDPLGRAIGLSGIILTAYLVAIPANEIVLPTILVLTTALAPEAAEAATAGRLFEFEDVATLGDFLRRHGWTTLTGVCLMLFSLCHNPCSTTIFTIWRETRSAKWTAVATLMPVMLGIVLCGAVATVARLLAN